VGLTENSGSLSDVNLAEYVANVLKRFVKRKLTVSIASKGELNTITSSSLGGEDSKMILNLKCFIILTD